MVGRSANSTNQQESGRGPTPHSNATAAQGQVPATGLSPNSAPSSSFQVETPTITLPKGGGAIRGIGEKFAANPVTGTGSMSVPIATSPGRSGFGPQLSLSYDSGAGNGPFGFGWSLSVPSITRKTDKGLPRYQDWEESDVFILSGAEDLVPVLVEKNGNWKREELLPRVVSGQNFQIQRYRPRIEGLFARIERWTNQNKPEDTFWRSISKDNITTWYGKTAESRIADPADPVRIFSWLICESYDDKGNVIVYQYKGEDSARIFQDAQGNIIAKAHEQNRTDQSRSSQRYLKHIRYGNHSPYFPELREDAAWPEPPGASEENGSQYCLFEVVFDYDDHLSDSPLPIETQPWVVRRDPFSSYRSGFEVRTYRLCQRVLMFHHFPGEEGVGENCLVRSTDFSYEYEADPAGTRIPIYSFLQSVIQSGYKRQGDQYLKKSLPPIEFEYTKPIVQDRIDEVDLESLENLPTGLDGSAYQWTDLHGEGIPGILTEQADAWFYKRNLSPLPVRNNGSESVKVRFAPVELLASKPNLVVAGGQAQFMDLAGDGQPDLVVLDGPTPGLYEHDEAEGWQPFRPFTSRLNRDTRDPNLKLVDLDGDGHADVLVTEDEAFVWHPSLAEEGFGAEHRVAQALDEEKGPRLVFEDGTQSIYLSDMSGDGLSDLVRIRNGEVCYWANLGYGRFGAKVAMDNAPWFDAPELFDHKRIRLADIDGSGTTDIIYLSADGARLYFNQSGNSWSQLRQLKVFPRIDDLVSIVPTDLLGNGTACLVWSSPLPSDRHRPMRYIDLMGGQKPHLLIKMKNNLGAETDVQYAPSTKFYLADKLAGKPWITRLPFPVHVVEKVTVTDKWRKTRFSTTYSYHHGYFDGPEREFRGFGRVDQIDTETFGTFAAGNIDSPYITDDRTLYQPPVKTVAWFLTGAFLQRELILSQYEDEYFPNWFEARDPTATNMLGSFRENALPEPDIDSRDLTSDERRQAMRACKGMMLRQEVYELDVDALERGEERPVKLFSTAYHNCHIRRLQPQADNRHAVFLVAESEAITYHYELDLRAETLTPDPRIAHTLNLRVDEFGNVLQSVAVVYPRLGEHEDNDLKPDDLNRIRAVQREIHLSYTETRYTNDIDHPRDPENYRLRVPREVLTYELTGIRPADEDDLASEDTLDDRYFTLDELRRFWLSLEHQTRGEEVAEIAYHEVPNRTTPQKRIVEHVRMLFFAENLRDWLPLGQLNARGLPYETYKLALTDGLLIAVLGDKLTHEVSRDLGDETLSGYLSGPALAPRFPGTDTTGQFWIRSGIAGFADDAAEHFFLPKRYTDPFKNVTSLEYDERDLFIESSTDPIGNTIAVTAFDYRVLAPRAMRGINNNHSEVAFDVLGLPAAMALKGKSAEADHLDDLTPEILDPVPSARARFFTEPYDEDEASRWLGSATARHLYDFGEVIHPDESITWGVRPASAAAILREKHVVQLANGETSPLQVAFEYSDGSGNLLVKKIQAEPGTQGGPLRWIATGKTILNNKGSKPVKQYEPYFSETGHRFDEAEAEREVGVTPVMYYDAPGRLVRTELPNGLFSRIEFSPWHVTSYDPNDTVRDSRWYTDRIPSDPPELPLPRDPITGELLVPPEQRAAWLATLHHDTPATMVFDSLGRVVVAVAHNRVEDAAGAFLHGGLRYRNEKYVTFTKLDAKGQPLWIRDARGNLVMQFITPPKPTTWSAEPNEDVPAGAVPCYDIAGNLLFQHSMDAGDRWMVNDVAGQPFYAWDVNNRVTDDGSLSAPEDRLFHTTYDKLRRPLRRELSVNDGGPQVIERFVYGEGLPHDAEHNLRGQVHQHYDPSGLITNERFDFKGNLIEVTRRLARNFSAPLIHWPEDTPQEGLEIEIFTRITECDALNRMTRFYNWHQAPSRVAVYELKYNERGMVQREDLYIRAQRETVDGRHRRVEGQRTEAIRDITYNAKGQRTSIQYGNGAATTYDHDEQTFRLIHLRTTRNTAPSLLQDLHYTYDPVGNITEIRDDAQQTVYFGNLEIRPHCSYEYDTLYRLTQAEGREHAAQNNVQRDGRDFESVIGIPFPNSPEALQNYTERYEYDAGGNILRIRHIGGSVERWTRHYQYATDSNRLLGTSLPGDPADVYSGRYDYDIHGSMINLNRRPQDYRLRWDYRDMIHHVNLGGGGQTWYNYDTAKQRTRKRIERRGGVVEERSYLSGMELYRRTNGTGLVEEIETHHLFADDQRVLIIEDVLETDSTDLGTRTLYRYQLGNHLGSVCVELDGSAAVVTYEEYHPYGTTAYHAGHTEVEVNLKRYCYTGKERDEESGLYYHGARYYAAWLARWVTSDPLALIDDINTYQFVRLNPVLYTDHKGTQADKVLALGLFQRSTEIAGKQIPLYLGREGVVASAQQSLPGAQVIDITQLSSWESVSGWLSGKNAPPGNFAGIRSAVIVQEAFEKGYPIHFDVRGIDIARRGSETSSELASVLGELASGKPRVDIHILGEKGLSIVRKGTSVIEGTPLPENLAQRLPPSFRGTNVSAAEGVVTEGAVAAARLGSKVLKGVGVAGAIVGSFVGGYQVGTGGVMISEGKTGEGVTTIAEGTANLGLTIGTAAAIKANLIKTTGSAGASGAAFTVAAGIAAAGAIALAAEETRRALRGEKTMAAEAVEYWEAVQDSAVAEGPTVGGALKYVGAGFAGAAAGFIASGQKDLWGLLR